MSNYPNWSSTTFIPPTRQMPNIHASLVRNRLIEEMTNYNIQSNAEIERLKLELKGLQLQNALLEAMHNSQYNHSLILDTVAPLDTPISIGCGYVTVYDLNGQPVEFNNAINNSNNASEEIPESTISMDEDRSNGPPPEKIELNESGYVCLDPMTEENEIEETPQGFLNKIFKRRKQ